MTVLDQIAKVNQRLAELLAPEKEKQQLLAEKQRLEQQQAQTEQTDAKAARETALHAASLQKHADLAVFRQKLREALPSGRKAKESIDAEGRSMEAYWPGEAEVLNKIIFATEQAIEVLDAQNWAQF